jgi:ABC-type Na+ efflux pump permease subunit
LILFFNEPVAVALAFAVPLALIYIFGAVFGGGPEGVRAGAVALAVVDASGTPRGAAVAASLAAEPAFAIHSEQGEDGAEVGVRRRIEAGEVRFAVVIETVGDEGAGVRVRLLQNPRNAIETALVEGLVERSVWRAAAEAMPAPPVVETETVVGEQVREPGPTRNVGGWAMMFLMFSLSSSAASLFEEKRAGLFLRLLAAPVRRTHILWSKFWCGTLIGVAQLLVLFGAGSLMYDIEVVAHLPALVVVATAAAAACTSFGMLLAAVARSQAVASGLATFLILTMSAVGGAWFPVSMMPEFLQAAARLTIVYWAMEGFLGVLWQGRGVCEVAPAVGVLSGMALGLNLVSAWWFRRGAMFR